MGEAGIQGGQFVSDGGEVVTDRAAQMPIRSKQFWRSKQFHDRKARVVRVDETHCFMQRIGRPGAPVKPVRLDRLPVGWELLLGFTGSSPIGDPMKGSGRG